MKYLLFLLVILLMVALACGTSDNPTPDSLTSSPTPTIDASAPLPNPILGDRWTRPSDNMIMVYVPAGTFPMGSDPAIDPNAHDDEQPQHEVTLDGFWIDRTEVTNEQYTLCVQDGSCEAVGPADNNSYHGDTQPVVGVSWFHAEDYCTWAGGQLPTEAQWEYAARGNDGRLYPWGNEAPTCELAQFSSCGGVSVPVGSFSPDGDSWAGAADMAGNVWEWVADWWYNNYDRSPQTNPTGPEDGEYKMLRGGSWDNPTVIVRSANRSLIMPPVRAVDIGFRCSAPGQ